tara:strand:- start:484 stop:657 length:174 start_codon:yes stop_codon:yes gene_type:complete
MPKFKPNTSSAMKKKSPIYKKSSGFKMKSSPTKLMGHMAALASPSAMKNYKKGYYGA